MVNGMGPNRAAPPRLPGGAGASRAEAEIRRLQAEMKRIRKDKHIPPDKKKQMLAALQAKIRMLQSEQANPAKAAKKAKTQAAEQAAEQTKEETRKTQNARPQYDRLVRGDGGEDSPGLYRVGSDEDGNRKVYFGPPGEGKQGKQKKSNAQSPWMTLNIYA